jgi:SAM-dependent methyltransferase
MISREMMQILRCPSCQGSLAEDSRGLACTTGGQSFSSVNGIVRFIDAEQYAGSFGFQWQRYSRTQLDTETCHRSEEAFRKRTGFAPEDLRGKLVLDVGCGMGRFADIAARWGARVVGVDLSAAVEAAAQNLSAHNCAIFQADVFHLPFPPGSFDVIYSIGVLHHTPDCAHAFKALPSLLKPGGKIAIWVYSSYNRWYRMSDIYRKLTRRMPPRFLHACCRAANPLYDVHQMLKKMPLLGRPASGALAYLFPMSFDTDPAWRVLDTFDWYSPWYQSKHTHEEVFRWFEDCGLLDVRVLDEPIGVQGRRPLATELTSSRERSETEPCVG